MFYYWHAYVTHPGKVPTDPNKIQTISTVCKKCIHPKPPRTHHCSVCDKCVLKMDHHCPWINGCIGHFNHRYFFFVMLFGFEIFYDELMNRTSDQNQEFVLLDRRNLIFFMAFITTGTFFLLGGLTIWHAKLIHKGETSIEAHINQAERKRLKKIGKIYRNPYDFGPWYNWCLFLGIINGRKWTSLLFPSKWTPKGSGLEWDTFRSCDIKWNGKQVPIIDASKLA